MECTAFNWDAFYHAAWNPLHSMTLHGIHCINRDAFYHAEWNPLHSVTLHGIHCSQSGSIVPHCRETTAFNRHPLSRRARNPILFPGTPFVLSEWKPLHQSGCILPCCMESTAFSDA